MPFPFADVVKAADVGMRDLSPDADFLIEPLDLVGIAADALRKELQRDRLAELDVVGAIDFAHTATTEKGDDAIALSQESAGSEARLAGARGRAIGRTKRRRFVLIRPGPLACLSHRV